MQAHEIARRVTGLIELDNALAPATLTAPGRGQKGVVFARYLAAYILVDRFNVPVEHTAHLLNRDRGTVTKALKVFRFLEGYQGWRQALALLGDLSERFIEFGAQRQLADVQTPAPVGRERKNDPLPAWVRERYAQEVENAGETMAADEARAQREADNIYLAHPAVRAITDDPELVSFIGQPVVAVSLSPLDEHARQTRPVLIVPPEERSKGAIALRLLVKGDSPHEIKAMMAARACASRALFKAGYRLTGVAETFAARDFPGWRYMPFHLAEIGR